MLVVVWVHWLARASGTELGLNLLRNSLCMSVLAIYLLLLGAAFEAFWDEFTQALGDL